MAIIKQTNSRRNNRVGWIILGALALCALLLIAINRINRPPQMGSDEEVFKTVDALFTAVTARDEKLLAECEERLHANRKVGKLPKGAAAYLDKVITQAHRGQWESAAESLYEFMLAQRRDGADQRLNHEKATKTEGAK